MFFKEYFSKPSIVEKCKRMVYNYHKDVEIKHQKITKKRKQDSSNLVEISNKLVLYNIHLHYFQKDYVLTKS